MHFRPSLLVLLLALPAALAILEPRSCPALPSGFPDPPDPVKFNSAPKADNPCSFPDGYKACTDDELSTVTCQKGQWQAEVCGMDAKGNFKKSCHSYVNWKDPHNCHKGYTGWSTYCTGIED